MRRHRLYRWSVVVMMAGFVLLGTARDGFGQLGALVSPGRLSKAHASLEGITSCLSCHTAGQGVSAQKCLSCHKPVAERIAQKRGVHRNVTTNCVSCHVEHAGVDGELRPFDTTRFDHAADTGFALDGLHAPLTSTCSACHKQRSFLGATSSCSSCHSDPHKGSLGPQCSTCHTTRVAFKETRQRFDHSRTQFPLSGAHQSVACASCHKSTNYKAVEFSSCASCHRDPHVQKLGAACASCHTTQSWRSTKVDHSRTAFPLKGLHADVACAKCHTAPATTVKPASKTCASCHADPHKGGFKQDCSSCHTEAGFKKGTFDHAATKFPLVDKHAALVCVKCHTTVSASAVAPPSTPTGRGRPAPTTAPQRNAAFAADFRGLSSSCVGCHTDVHHADLGTACEKCHSAKAFAVETFVHAAPRAFFNGGHQSVGCAKCHAPAALAASRLPAVPFTRTATTCVSCHADVHLGQLGATCETCHAIDAPHFALRGFSHDRTSFPLKGKHVAVTCNGCHKPVTTQFKTGTGTAVQYDGVGTACKSCHVDPHAGQFVQGCESCHGADSFKIPQYRHLKQQALSDFFRGPHVKAACAACHKPTAAKTATAVLSFKTATTCTNCHVDIHRGGLGNRCESCHKL